MNAPYTNDNRPGVRENTGFKYTKNRLGEHKTQLGQINKIQVKKLNTNEQRENWNTGLNQKTLCRGKYRTYM